MSLDDFVKDIYAKRAGLEEEMDIAIYHGTRNTLLYEAQIHAEVDVKVRWLRKDKQEVPPGSRGKPAGSWITDRRPKKSDGRYVIAWYAEEKTWFSTYRKRVQPGQPWLPIRDLVGDLVPDEGPKVSD